MFDWLIGYSKEESESPQMLNEIGNVEIRFSEKKGIESAYIQYVTKKKREDEIQMDLIYLFCLYYAKMLFNLGSGEYSDALIKHVQAISSNMFNPKADLFKLKDGILPADVQLSDKHPKTVLKTYSAKLIAKENGTLTINTYFEPIGEGYYAPISTLALLQWTLNKIEIGLGMYLFTAILGMNKYYREVQDYAELESVIKAPTYGLQLATEMFKEKM